MKYRRSWNLISPTYQWVLAHKNLLHFFFQKPLNKLLRDSSSRTETSLSSTCSYLSSFLSTLSIVSSSSISFFEIGFAYIFRPDSDPENISELCKLYIISWLVTCTMWGIPNLGIMFCRFIFVRYGHGLVANRVTR